MTDRDSEHRFSVIFAPELFERLEWFVRLRWLAVAGLVGASLSGPRLGLARAFPALLALGLFVAAYNGWFWHALRRLRDQPQRYGNLRGCAIRQMVMDLAALLVAAFYTGGLQSPLLPFFTIHMALGTIMIATRMMYVVASGTAAALVVAHALQGKGWLEAIGIPPQGGAGPQTGDLHAAAVIIAMFGIVYLTDSVTSRFKHRNIELHRATRRLRQRGDELQRLLEEMQRVEQRKSHYMRISAHQLRSPLGTIRTSLDVLRQGIVDPRSDRGRRLLDGVAERVDSLLAIVTDLLELARIREGSARAPWSRQVNLNQLLADLFDSLGPAAEQKRITLVPRFRGAAILEWGVAPDLVFAFENLITNAIKYSPEGSEVIVRLRPEGDRARIEIEDEGIGIPEELLGDVFLEFVRAPNAKHFTPEGTGLGLAIVREVVESHGGTVWAERRNGAGTRFVVELPLSGQPPAKRKLVTGQ